MRYLCFGVFIALVVICSAQDDPNYDHQTTTYNSQFQGVTITDELTITPYFSPDTSIDVETNLILSATSSIDIGIPSVGSWSGCTCGDSYSKNCTVTQLRDQEAFPIFAALLNAIHSGITVRILTNFYPPGCSDGAIDQVGYWALAGAQVKYYSTTTFLHTKYINVDQKRASVSSVNFSKTSFTKNREAGVIIEGDNSGPILAFLDKVFTSDFNNGVNWPTGAYSASDMQIINDPTLLAITIPTLQTFNGFVTSLNPVTDTMTVEIFTSPDFAYDTVVNALNNCTNSFSLFIYQITDDLCNSVQQMSSLSNFQLLVSDKIYSYDDWKKAEQCYTSLYNNNVPIYKTASNMYTFSHNKFWILDSEVVFMSTGNWGTSDYPSGSASFPPYGSSGWRDVNRDFTVSINHPSIVKQFQDVIDGDMQYATQWQPYDGVKKYNKHLKNKHGY